MRITIDRSLSLPVYLQIKGQIAYGIAIGELKSGERLPPIRQLANDIGIAPLTVMQALEALVEDGLIETRPGVGSFVVELHADALARSHKQAIDELVQQNIGEALQRGITPHEYASAVWATVFPTRKQGAALRDVIFVGNYEDSIHVLNDLIAAELAPLGVCLHPYTIEELREPSAELSALLATVDVIVAVPLRFAEVRRLLGDHHVILGLPLMVSTSAREMLAQVHNTARVGLVATESTFTQSMRNIVSIYRPASKSAPVVVIDDEQAVVEMMSHIDVVVYSMGIREKIRPYIPRNVLAIELTHNPDPAALSELKEELARIFASEEETAAMIT